MRVMRAKGCLSTMSMAKMAVPVPRAGMRWGVGGLVQVELVAGEERVHVAQHVEAVLLGPVVRVQ